MYLKMPVRLIMHANEPVLFQLRARKAKENRLIAAIYLIQLRGTVSSCHHELGRSDIHFAMKHCQHLPWQHRVIHLQKLIQCLGREALL